MNVRRVPISLICFASSFALVLSMPSTKEMMEQHRGVGCAEMPTLADFDIDDIGHRIINGTKTLGPLPYQLQLKLDTVHDCGAVLISPSWALSAEHCISDSRFGGSIKQYQMVAGAYWDYGHYRYGDHPDDQIKVQMRYLKRVIQLNPLNDKPKGYMNPDIVIIELERPFEMTPFVKPACLPSRPVEKGTKCITSGWGYTMDPVKEKEGLLKPLQAVEVEIVDWFLCYEPYNQTFRPLHQFEICAANPYKDSCWGDSGGPLVCATDGGATLHGIVSWGGWRCADPDYPGVYVDVFRFMDQIKEYLNDNPCPSTRWYQDGWCDMDLNNPKHCFDGGDCCNYGSGMESEWHCTWRCEGADGSDEDCLEKCRCYLDQDRSPIIPLEKVSNKMIDGK